MTNGIIIRNGVKYAGGSSSSNSDVKVVDVVEKGNKNAISSNAVANAVENITNIIQADWTNAIDGKENILTKTYNFKNYYIQFFGDSIAAGVGCDDDTTDLNLYKRWPTIFCNKVGSVEVNQSVSGSLFTEEKDGIGTIKSKIQSSLNTTYPYLFINGGINDWQWGIPLNAFSDAVDDTFSYIKDNYSYHVVVISPFNVLRHLVGSPAYSLDEYRKILAQKAYKYGFDYINGGKMSLVKSKVGAYIYHYSDGLHPSGFGHYLIGNEIAQQFFGLDWTNYDAINKNSEFVFSGKYVPDIYTPIWKVLFNNFHLSANENVNLTRLSSELSSDKVIIQSVNGCIMYANTPNDVSCPLPLNHFMTGTNGKIDYINFYCITSGFECQYLTGTDITNGNIFVEFIRYFDMNHTHTF